MLRLLQAIDRSRFCPVVVLFSSGPLVQKLRDSGIDVHVLEMDASVVKHDRMDAARVSVTTARAAWKSATFAVRLAWALRRLKIDLVHTTSLKADVLGTIAARAVRRPVVWYIHDRISPDYLPAQLVPLVRWAARRLPTHVIANSRATLATLGPIAVERCTVAYPGVPAWALSDAGSRHDSGTPLIGIVGRISPTKGQEIFVRAAAEIARVRPDVRFVVIGAALFNERDYERRVHRLSQDLGLGGNIEFTGFVDDVAARMRELTVLVHASPIPEPFGQVVVEAMAAGVPVVATRGGGVPEIIRGERGAVGILVEPGDVPQLAAAVAALLAAPIEARAMAARARDWAAEAFTIDATAGAVMAAWTGCLN